MWVDIERRGKSYVIKDSERRKLDNAYLSTLESLGLEPAKACGIQSLLTPKTASEQNTANDKVPPITHGQELQQAKSGSAQPEPRAQEPLRRVRQHRRKRSRHSPRHRIGAMDRAARPSPFGGATQIAPAIELYTVLGAKVQGRHERQQYISQSGNAGEKSSFMPMCAEHGPSWCQGCSFPM